jgi:adenylate cyclase
VREDRQRLLAAALLISLAMSFVVLVIREQKLLEPVELIGYDLMLTLRPAPAPEPRVSLIALSEADIAAMGRWPVTDAALAAALDIVSSHAPRVIGLDIYRDLPVPPGTARLEDAFNEHGSVIGIFKFHTPGSEGVGPPPALARSGRVGFSDIVLDEGAIARRGLAFVDDGQSVATAFSLQLALAYLQAEGIRMAPDPKHPEHFRLGKTTFRPLGRNFGGYVDVDDAGYQFMIDFSRGDGAFPRYSWGDLMANRIPHGALTDRIVILGVDAESVKDSFATPLGQWPWAASPMMPGIALHANLTDQFIRAALTGTRPITALPRSMEVALIILAGLVGGLTGLAIRSERRLFVFAGVGACAVALIGYLLFLWNVWIPVFPMAGGWVLSSALVTGYLLHHTRQDRAALRRLLSLQVSPAVAAAIWDRRAELLDEGVLRPQQLPATVLFMDLQGFTRISEALPPHELIAWLNPVMALATRTVLEHGGMVDDYFGDGLKANFGVPFPGPRDADAAVRCAIALVHGIRRCSDGAAHPYLVRIGIHSGPVIAGSIGSAERWKYTTIGDTVNVAARLESHAKELPVNEPARCRILLSAETVRLLEEPFDLRPLGQVALRGRARSISVHEVECQETQTGAATVEYLGRSL